MINYFFEGGIRVTDITSKLPAFKTSWVKRLASDNVVKWKLIPQIF